MSKVFTRLLVGLTTLLPLGATAQIANAGFEEQYSWGSPTQSFDLPPTQQRNVIPLPASQLPGGSYANQLPGWQAVTAESADFLATNAGSAVVNPQGTPPYGTFTPHSGRGCVALMREPGSTQDQGSQSITQPVSLIGGHYYQVSFYALRRPGARWREKMAARISAAAPTSGAPAPYATIVSQPIGDHQNWTLVTGSFLAPGPNGQSSPAYLTIGYDNSAGSYDPSLYSVGRCESYVAIDDVSLVDQGDACSFYLDPYWPLNFCLNQNRKIRVRNPLAASGYIFTWKFFKRDASGVLQPYQLRGRSMTFTTSVPELYITGGDFRNTPGEYSYDVSAVNTATGCSTGWQGPANGDISFNVEADCTFNPGDDVPRPTATAQPTGPPQQLAYPNPVSTRLTLPAKARLLELLNSAGQPVQTRVTTNQLDVQHLPEGLYLLRLLRNGNVETQRIVVKH